MLHDIVYYGEMIGTYSFAMGVSAYLVGLVFKSPRAVAHDDDHCHSGESVV